jgi:hypothetical protein
MARWLAGPPLALAAAGAAIACYYSAYLGHSPDWARYTDYLASFASEGHVDTQQHNPNGAIWVLLIAFCAVSVGTIAALGRRASWSALAVGACAFGTLWAASGYYVLRVFELYLLSLTPLICTSLLLILFVIGRERALCRLDVPIRASMIPIVVVLLTIGFANGERLGDWARAMRRGYVRSVDRLMPPMDPSLAQLLERAGVGSRDAITYIDNRRAWLNSGPLPLWPAHDRRVAKRALWRNRAWTPGVPFVLFITLPKDRPELYITRFAERAKLGGWLIEARDAPKGLQFPWFHAALRRDYVPVDFYQDTTWKLTRYEWRGRPDSPGRERMRSGIVPTAIRPGSTTKR